MNKKRRVVVTGVGIVSPNGVGKEACWKNMINGVSAVSPTVNSSAQITATVPARRARDKVGRGWRSSSLGFLTRKRTSRCTSSNTEAK